MTVDHTENLPGSADVIAPVVAPVTAPVTAPVVELIMDRDCPNVALCRAALHAALERAHLPVAWREWDRNAPETPVAYRHFGSPTILVNGRDIGGTPGVPTAEGNSCRVYADDASGRLAGAPAVQSILEALRTHAEQRSPSAVSEVRSTVVGER